jgi:hypothetical protein
VHAPCLARWQLHSAGTPEETACRFCNCALPDWKTVLTPAAAAEAAGGGCPAPTMSVTFNGAVHHVVVRGGPGGYDAFIADVRAIFGIDGASAMQLAFDCADPVSGALVKLNGAGAYHAAVHCASISAAKRAAAWAGGAGRAAAAAPTTSAPATPPCGALPPRAASTASEPSTESSSGRLDAAIEAALEAARGGEPAVEAAAPLARRARPRRAARRPDDVRRALTSMAASLRRLHDAAAAAAGPAERGPPPARSALDPDAIRSLQARVAGLLRSLPAAERGRGGGVAVADG